MISDRAAKCRLVLLVQVALQALLAAIPTVLGIRYFRHREDILSSRQAIVLGMATAVLAGVAIWLSGWQQAAIVRWSGGAWIPSAYWKGRLLPFAILCWPASYLLANASYRVIHAHERVLCSTERRTRRK